MNLDEAQLNALPPKDRARYMALERLFSHPSWKIVMAMAEQRMAEQTQRAAFATSWDNNRIAVGVGAGWNEIKQLEESTEAFYAAKLEEVERAATIAAAAEEAAFE